MCRPLAMLAVVALDVAFAGVLCAANIDSNLAASPATQAGGGGCYPVGLDPGPEDPLNVFDPEWAAIDVGTHSPPVADPITLHGTVALSKINEIGDYPASHEGDDQNTFLIVDPADMSFVATGNLGPHGEEAGQLEVEWEIAKYPLFAWAGAGDRMTTVGRWIWDCGHADPDPVGACSVTTSQACVVAADCAPPACPGCMPGQTCGGVTFNYHSELHPPQALAVSRTGQGFAFAKKPRGGRPATRTDVWISPDGGGAGDRCVVTHRPNPLDLVFVTNCFPLAEPLANVNASDFAFDVPLPPRPPGRSRRPRVRVYDRTPRRLPRPAVTTTFVDGPAPFVHAVVDMTTPVRGRLPSMVGKTIVAGWRGDRTPTTRLAVRVTAIEILNPLKPLRPAVPLKQRCSASTAQDCSAMPCPAGESCLSLGGPVPGWEVFVEINGIWQRLAGLEDVQTPRTVRQRRRFDVALPVDGALHLHASGRSLDCRETLYGMSLARILGLYGIATDGPACLLAASHDIGELDLSFPGPDFGSGGGSAAHVTQSLGGAGGSCTAAPAELCLTDADCPGGTTCAVSGGSYKLHYTISKRR